MVGCARGSLELSGGQCLRLQPASMSAGDDLLRAEDCRVSAISARAESYDLGVGPAAWRDKSRLSRRSPPVLISGFWYNARDDRVGAFLQRASGEQVDTLRLWD